MDSLTIGLVYSYESPSQLKNCLAAIESEVKKLRVNSVEWVLVQTPKAHGRDLSFFPGRVIRSDTENLGINRNLVLQSATCEAFYFTDPDCLLQENSLVRLVEAFDREKHNPNIFAVAGPNLLTSGHSLLGDFLKWLGKAHWLNGGLSQISIRNHDLFDWHSPTCNILYKRKALGRLQFSSQFDMVGEDLEFHFRQSRKNRKILICSGALVWHDQGKDLFAYFKKVFNYGLAQTRLLKVHPSSAFNKRLSVLFGFLFFLIFLDWLYWVAAFVIATLVFLYEILRARAEKQILAFGMFSILLFSSYLMGQIFGLIIPTLKLKNEKSKMANIEYF